MERVLVLLARLLVYLAPWRTVRLVPRYLPGGRWRVMVRVVLRRMVWAVPVLTRLIR